MKHFFLFLITVCLVKVAYAQQMEFAWLIGSWKLKDKNVFEVWQKKTGSNTLQGKSYKIVGSDTVTLEKIQLVKKDQSFFYVADAAGNQKPIEFKITSYSKHSFVAENPDHDFPKLIRYKYLRKENNAFIQAAIEGNGKTIPYDFQWVR